MDLRDSGDKVAPVDCNLYPAGFNNICEVDLEHASRILKKEISNIAATRRIPIPERLGIIPENHTENRFYLENLHVLKGAIEAAGFEVEVLRLDGGAAPLELTTASGKIILQHPMRIGEGRAFTDSGFHPDWLILNQDFSGGAPAVLDTLSQPILPSHRMGWHSRKKSTHFHFYNALAEEFAGIIGIDPWRITIDSVPVENVNFGEGSGIDQVEQRSSEMLSRIEEQYRKHGIERRPALFIKNDSGTYGMGIMVIHSADELKTMNRRTRNKMSMGKNKSAITGVLLQEGIPTQMTTDGSSSEPVIYMAGASLIGGFIRANRERDDMDNLNSQGMFFKKLCFKDLSDCLESGDFEEFPTLEAVYGVIAKLSALAAALEIRQTLGP